MAGITLFTNHIMAAVKTMPSVFALNKPNSCLLASPLKPNSAIGIDGTTANTKNNTQTIHDNCHQFAFTSNNCNNNKY